MQSEQVTLYFNLSLPYLLHLYISIFKGLVQVIKQPPAAVEEVEHNTNNEEDNLSLNKLQEVQLDKAQVTFCRELFSCNQNKSLSISTCHFHTRFTFTFLFLGTGMGYQAATSSGGEVEHNTNNEEDNLSLNKEDLSEQHTQDDLSEQHTQEATLGQTQVRWCR